MRRLLGAGWWPLACALALLMSTGDAAAAAWTLSGAGHPLTAAETATAEAAFIAATRALPPSWRQAAGLDVHVQWRDDLPEAVHGRINGDRMRLRRSLLAAGDPAAPALQAAIVHELAHRYDRSPHGGLSRDPRLLDLAGWPQQPLRFGRRVRRNAMHDRSPDAYELASPAEFVAVNLEYFLRDPEYACRRPALYRYFSAHFGWSPPAARCAPELPFVVAEADDTGARLETLDPARVYAVDYLLAEGDTEAMSAWGHSMLRLVVCAPGRPPGPACRLDLEAHRVLSFRAFVDDVQISGLRGLTGRYPSRLFVLPFGQVVDEYTRVELRGLQSVPLALSQAEIASLLERAARVHWSYDGRYYFIGNNCAVETWKLLQAGVPRLEQARLRSITPRGLLRRLVRSGNADTSVLQRADAVAAGYYFPAADTEYQALLEVVRASRAMPPMRVQDWLALAPQQRARWFAGSGEREAAALLVLEHAAERQNRARLRDAFKRRLGRRREALAPVAADVHALLALGDGLTRPAQMLEDGYGLPDEQERGALQDSVQSGAQKLRSLRSGVEAAALAMQSDAERARTSALADNLDWLGAHLRALHRQAGGLELD